MNTIIGYVVTFFVVVMLAVSPAQAMLMTAEDGRLAASVDFSFVDRDLKVILTNTSTADVWNASQVLTGVFFSLSGGTFSPISATLTDGSTVLFGPSNGGNVGGEWAYATGLSGAPGGANSGISSSGLGLFGDANFGSPIDSPNLQGPVAVNGLQYGITSAGDDPATGNTGVTSRFPLIKNSVTFLLRYSGSFEDLSAISNVSFQYGTSLAEPNVGVPEPGTLALLGMGLVGIGIFRRRK